MEAVIDFTRSAQDNANSYYSRSKKLLGKAEGAERAVSDLESQIAQLKNDNKTKEKKEKKLRDRKWYEAFHWFFTSGSRMVIAGRDARQNELLNSKHFDDNDLFFHADIFGAAVTILKDGMNAGDDEKLEVAQFAASYSSAWKEALGSIDVYAMRRGQVSKSTGKGSLGTGSFLLSGGREWFHNTALGLAMMEKEGSLVVMPLVQFYGSVERDRVAAVISIGREKKSDAAKKVLRILGYDDLDEVMQQLPAGNFDVKQADARIASNRDK